MGVKFVTGPKADLIGEMKVDRDKVKALLLSEGFTFDTDAEHDGDFASETSGRVCYLAFDPHQRRHAGDGQNAAYLANIRDQKHTSVTEHSVFWFLIRDFSKNVTQEFVRTRVGMSPSVQSGRYTDPFDPDRGGTADGDATANLPPRVAAHPDLVSLWRGAWSHCEFAYKQTVDVLRGGGLDLKSARGDAREILPGGVCNWLTATFNARALDHLFRLRGSVHAEQSYRQLAANLYREVKGREVFAHWSETTCPKGLPLLVEDK